MASIQIKDLLLRTEVGFNPHELGKKQDLLINVIIYYSTTGEEVTDEPEEALDYRALCKSIIDLVENNRYNLLEKVCNDVASLLLNNSRIQKVKVEVDKPHALRFARSVSFALSRTKEASS